MTRPLIITPEAEDDLAEGREWYNAQCDGLGARFVEAVDVVLRGVAATPEMHAVVRRDVRKAVVRRFPYVVYYRIELVGVAVLAVHHAKRNPARWQSRIRVPRPVGV